MVEQFELFLIDVKAFLKAAGFKSSGKTFNRAYSDNVIQVINIQLGQRSMQGLFTINLGLTNKDNAARTAFVTETKCAHRERIGFVIGTNDIWWKQHDMVGDRKAEVLQALAAGLEWLDKNSIKRPDPPKIDWTKIDLS